MAFGSSATLRRQAASVMGEEIAVVGLGVRVVVAVRRGHEGHVIAQKCRRIMAPGCIQ